MYFRFLVLLCGHRFEKFAVLCIEMHVVRGKNLGCTCRSRNRSRSRDKVFSIYGLGSKPKSLTEPQMNPDHESRRRSKRVVSCLHTYNSLCAACMHAIGGKEREKARVRTRERVGCVQRSATCSHTLTRAHPHRNCTRIHPISHTDITHANVRRTLWSFSLPLVPSPALPPSAITSVAA